jgi:5S rRNA maturation endonuclease (ribonuclease M5)
MGADEIEIQRLVIDALRVREFTSLTAPPPEAQVRQEVSFDSRALPPGSLSFAQWRTHLSLASESEIVVPELQGAVTYISGRCEPLAGENNMMSRYDFYVTDSRVHNMHRRVIIPCMWEGRIIGHTARAWDPELRPKYMANYDGNYVFNLDRQQTHSQFVIVTEGPFDAMAIDGVGTMHNEISDTQADLIQALGREVIVVPDFDYHYGKWSGERLVDQALEFGWSVSFPIWAEKYKDVSEAVQHLGKLYTMQAILSAKESNKLRIELKKRAYK